MDDITERLFADIAAELSGANPAPAKQQVYRNLVESIFYASPLLNFDERNVSDFYHQASGVIFEKIQKRVQHDVRQAVLSKLRLNCPDINLTPDLLDRLRVSWTVEITDGPDLPALSVLSDEMMLS